MEYHAAMKIFMKNIYIYIHDIILNKMQKAKLCVYYDCNYF